MQRPRSQRDDVAQEGEIPRLLPVATASASSTAIPGPTDTSGPPDTPLPPPLPSTARETSLLRAPDDRSHGDPPVLLGGSPVGRGGGIVGVVGVTVEEAYRKWGDELVGFATALVGPADVPDLVSEAFAAVLVRGEAFWSTVATPRVVLVPVDHQRGRMAARSGLRRRARELRWSAHPVAGELLSDPVVRRALDRLNVQQCVIHSPIGMTSHRTPSPVSSTSRTVRCDVSSRRSRATPEGAGMNEDLLDTRLRQLSQELHDAAPPAPDWTDLVTDRVPAPSGDRTGRRWSVLVAAAALVVAVTVGILVVRSANDPAQPGPATPPGTGPAPTVTSAPVAPATDAADGDVHVHIHVDVDVVVVVDIDRAAGPRCADLAGRRRRAGRGTGQLHQHLVHRHGDRDLREPAGPRFSATQRRHPDQRRQCVGDGRSVHRQQLRPHYGDRPPSSSVDPTEPSVTRSWSVRPTTACR